jgi:hypothetical protein
MNNVDLLKLLATQPRKAFEALGERPRFWFPLLLAVVVTVVTTYGYYRVADLAWVIDETLRSNPRTASMSDADRARAAQAMTPAVLMWSSVIGVIVLVPLLRALESTYYLLAGKVTNVQRSFGHWFALANWSALPTLLVAIPAAIVLATTVNGQIDSSAIQPLSLNELFLHRRMGEPGYQLFVSLSILQPLGWLLAAIGVHEWSKRSWLFSAIFVLLPSVLIYGCWAWFALR